MHLTQISFFSPPSIRLVCKSNQESSINIFYFGGCHVTRTLSLRLNEVDQIEYGLRMYNWCKDPKVFNKEER